MVKKNILLIGLLLGIIFFCSLNSCSNYEYFSVRKGKGGKKSKFREGVKNILDTAGSIAKDTASVAGEVVKIAKESGEEYNDAQKTDAEVKKEDEKKKKRKR
tara:strand:+ start:1818 stop:2123 length:306 start_codon:yes stop_codon:yes gene_type:complete